MIKKGLILLSLVLLMGCNSNEGKGSLTRVTDLNKSVSTPQEVVFRDDEQARAKEWYEEEHIKAFPEIDYHKVVITAYAMEIHGTVTEPVANDPGLIVGDELIGAVKKIDGLYYAYSYLNGELRGTPPKAYSLYDLLSYNFIDEN